MEGRCDEDSGLWVCVGNSDGGDDGGDDDDDDDGGGGDDDGDDDEQLALKVQEARQAAVPEGEEAAEEPPLRSGLAQAQGRRARRPPHGEQDLEAGERGLARAFGGCSGCQRGDGELREKERERVRLRERKSSPPRVPRPVLQLPRPRKRRKTNDSDVDEVMTLTSTDSTVSASAPSSPERAPLSLVDFSRVFDDDDDDDDDDNDDNNDNDNDDDNNNNDNENNSNNNSNDLTKKTPFPILGELGTQPAVFIDETTSTTPTTTAASTTTTTTTTGTTSAAKQNVTRLQCLRSRALRLQKKQWAKLQQLPLAHLVRVLLFSQSFLNSKPKLNPNPSLAHAEVAEAAAAVCVRVTSDRRLSSSSRAPGARNARIG